MSDQWYANYAIGQDMRAMAAVVGEESLNEEELKYLDFTESLKLRSDAQGPYENRDVFSSLDIVWTVLRVFPQELLTKLRRR